MKSPNPSALLFSVANLSQLATQSVSCSLPARRAHNPLREKGSDGSCQLYDNDRNKHVSLSDIRKMIVAGRDIRFVDEYSGNDITVPMLVYIITEKEQSELRTPCDVLIA